MSLSLEDYSEKAIVVRGDTKEFKDQLLQAGGKFNQYLKNGAGWIFSKKNEEKIQELINSLNSVESKPIQSKSIQSKPVESKQNDNIKTILQLAEKLSCEEKLHLISEIALLSTKPKNTTKIIGKTPVPLASKVKSDVVESHSSKSTCKPVYNYTIVN